MDLYTTELLLKCEPEVEVKFEPLFTESSYNETVNNDLVKTECEAVSFSPSNCGPLNDIATFLPTSNISASVKPAFKEESPAASDHSQEKTGNLMDTPKTQARTRHSCPYCNRNFTRRDSFSNHLRRRHSKKNPDFLVEKFDKKCFTCDICKFKSSCSRSLKSHMLIHERFVDGTESSNKSSIQVHIQSKHSNDTPTYTCRFCNKTFCKKTSLAAHLLSQHDDNFDKSLKTILSQTIKYCNLCDFRVISQSMLNSHIQSKHSDDTPTIYTCRFCNKTLCKKISLAAHLLTHHEENFDKSLKTLLSQTINHCKICDFRSIGEHYIKRHIQSKHCDDRRTYTCRFCKKTFYSKRSLGDHLLCHHGDKFDTSLKTLLAQTINHCKLCDFRSIGEHHLNRHIQSKHSDDRPIYTCRFCNKILYSKGSLVDHLLCYHGDKFDRSLKTLLSQTIKHCNLCDFRIISKLKLIEHIQREHFNQRPTYTCRFCDKTLCNKERLAHHLVFYHGDKFDKSLNRLLGRTIKRCKLCDFRVVLKSKLDQHMRKHDDSPVNEHKFKCSNCVYETCYKSNLQKHMQRQHYNERHTYSCRFCNKTLFQKPSLANHLLVRHGDKFDKSLKTILSQTINHCKLCDFRTITKTKLNRHMTKHAE